MCCNSCSRLTLGTFIRSLTNLERTSTRLNVRLRTVRLLSTDRRLRSAEPPSRVYSETNTLFDTPNTSSKHTIDSPTPQTGGTPSTPPQRKKEPWQIAKAALKEKLGGEAWNPRKKLSPDTMEGIRHLNQTSPDKFTTAVLAQYFKVSPDAIRRILKSKWRPTDAEYEERLKRWDQRGERIWSNLVELGVKPPKKWRQMGVGKAEAGGVPNWKGKRRNTVPVKESMTFNEDLIPIVGQDGNRVGKQKETVFDRLL